MGFNIKSLIPYYGDHTVRQQVDKLFSREVLGSVLLGKFIGDYATILLQRGLGTDIAYVSGIIITVIIFIYWEKIERAAEEKKKEAEEKLKQERETETFV